MLYISIRLQMFHLASPASTVTLHPLLALDTDWTSAELLSCLDRPGSPGCFRLQLPWVTELSTPSPSSCRRALDAELHERLRGGESAGEAEKRLFLGAVASNPALVARISGARDPAGETERVLEEMRRAREAIRKGGGPGG